MYKKKTDINQIDNHPTKQNSQSNLINKMEINQMIFTLRVYRRAFDFNQFLLNKLFT